MSRENVELVRRIQPGRDTEMVELFRDEARATAVLGALAPLFHEDFETVAPNNAQARRYTGLDGLRAGWLDWLEPWQSYRTEVEDLIDAGDDVVVLVRDYGRRAGMAVEVPVLAAAVWTVRDGKVARASFYLDRDEAFAAVGLPAPSGGAAHRPSP